MPGKPTTQPQLIAENQDLRARLEKAEATLSEILSGEADALFVTGAGGAQLFTLKGADQAYRTLIENMSEGALTLTPEGLVLYANRRFAGMLGTPLEKVIGSEIHNWFAPECRHAIQALLRKDAADNYREELTLAAAGGTRVPVYLSVSRILQDGMPDSICMVATDLTEQKRNEAILAAERLSNAILEQAADAIVICDETGRIMRASKQAQAIYGNNPIGQLFEHAFPLRQPDGTAFTPVGAIDPSHHQSIEARLERNGRGFDLLVSVGHLKGARNELLGSVVTLTDITAIMHAEEALRRSESEFRTLAESMPQIVWITRPDGWNIYFNHQWMEYTGMTLEESLGHGWNKPFHPDDQQRAWDAWQRATAESGIYSIESRLRRADGIYRWWLVRGVPLKDAAGNILKWFGTCTDIHDLKTAELEISRANRELRESERRFSGLLGNVELVSMMLDREAHITYCNDYLLRLTGWRQEDVIGQNWFALFVPPEINDLKEGFFAALLANQPEALHHENEILTRSGERRLIRWSNSVLRSAAGDVIGTASIGEDITERIRAEQALTQLQRQSELILKSVVEGIYVIDIEGRIIFPNPVATELLGYSINELSGKHAHATIHYARKDGTPYPISECPIHTTIRDGAVRKVEDEVYWRKDGSSFQVAYTSAPVRDEHGDITGAVVAFRDITQRKGLELEKEQYFKFFMLSTNAMCIADPYGCFKRVNPAFVKLTGYSESELLAKPFIDFVLQEDRQKTMDEMKLQVEIRPTLHFENRYVCKDGTVVRLLWMSYFDRLDHTTYATAEDITERKASETRIAFLNRVYAMLSGINTLIVRVRDRDELFKEACRVALETGGFRMALIAIVDPDSWQIVPVASAGKDDALLAAIERLLSSGEDAPNTMIALAVREKKIVVSNDALSDPRVLLGKQYIEAGIRSMVILPLIVANEVAGVITLYAGEVDFFHEAELKLLTELAGDISFAIDHLGKQTRLDYLAYYDVLTGLANRRLFLDRVAQYMVSAVSGRHKLALCLIDLERFKNINDSLGRSAGDALLKQVAEWLTHKQGGANLLARVDADHFAVVVPEVRQEGDLSKLFDNVSQGFLDHPFKLNDDTFRIAAKAGIAIFPDDGADVDTLFRNAEAALKKAKASGARYLFYTQKMTEAVAGKLTLENQLRQAIDDEEFVLHYQPKVNLASGKVTSAEALIRWNDPRTGLVPPGKFIPILEETGLIHEVGRWALHQAIADYLRWRNAGLDAVRIAVNVSALQLRNPGFLVEIEQAIAIDAHAAEGVELEITESLVMDDVVRNITTLHAIRAMGITIAIDDFGTGFSSLNYLSKLPVDTLKIDRSFVIEMNSPEGLALVSTIIIVAHALKLKVVAEGVETGEQAGQLRSLNCDEMQGYLFSKPVPGDIFEAKFLAPVPPGDKQS